MITSQTWGRRLLFSREPWARLLIDTLCHYRGSAFFLHEFVVMPDHIHVLLTPNTSLEKAAQFIKGGFSYRAKKELGSNMEVWQKGFSDHRIRDAGDYAQHVSYIRENPVRKRLCERAEEFPYSSAHAGFELDPAPQGLKPAFIEQGDTARLKGAPLQSNTEPASDGAVLQSDTEIGSDGAALQSNTEFAFEGAVLRSNTGLASDGAVLRSNTEPAFEGTALRSNVELGSECAAFQSNIEPAFDGAVPQSKIAPQRSKYPAKNKIA